MRLRTRVEDVMIITTSIKLYLTLEDLFNPL